MDFGVFIVWDNVLGNVPIYNIVPKGNKRQLLSKNKSDNKFWGACTLLQLENHSHFESYWNKIVFKHIGDFWISTIF